MPIIVHFTDPHLSASTPEHPSPRKWRSGTYEQDILDKLSWVRQRAEALKTEDPETFLWCTGDIVDRPVEPLKTTLALADWVMSLRQKNLTLFLTLGQHDVKNYRVESVDECSVGVLSRLRGKPYYEGGMFGWECTSLHVGQSAVLTEKDPPALSGQLIVGTHLDIHPDAFGCVRPRDIHWAGVKLVLCAHIHKGGTPCEHNGTWFSAPGALCRLNADEIHRQPQISVIRLSGAGEVQSVEYEDVPSRPAEEVFDLGAMEYAQESQRERTQFQRALGEVAGEQGVVGDWRSLLEAARPVAGDDTVDRTIKYAEEV